MTQPTNFRYSSANMLYSYFAGVIFGLVVGVCFGVVIR